MIALNATPRNNLISSATLKRKPNASKEMSRSDAVVVVAVVEEVADKVEIGNHNRMLPKKKKMMTSKL